MARASILWLVGEYAERVPKIAPDVLRMAAKSFIKEVGLQFLSCLALNLPLFIYLFVYFCSLYVFYLVSNIHSLRSPLLFH